MAMTPKTCAAADLPRHRVDKPVCAPGSDAQGIAVDLDAIAGQAAPLNSDAQAAQLLREATSEPLGAELINALTKVDLTRLNAADRIHYLAAMQRAHNWLSGVFHVAAAAAAGPRSLVTSDLSPDRYSPTGDMHEDIVCAEVGAALNWTPSAAAALVSRSRAAVRELRPVNAQLLSGNWGELHLRRAMDACSDTESELVAAAAVNVTGRLRTASRCSPNTLRGRLQRELAVLAPEKVTTRIKAKRRDRSAELHNDNDLRGRLEVDAPWPALNWSFQELTTWAKQRLATLRELRRSYPDLPLCCTQAVNAATELLTSESHLEAERATTTTSRTDKGSPDMPSVSPGPCTRCGASADRLPTLSQLRADALLAAIELLSASRRGTDGQSASPEPRRGRRWRHAIVVCDLATALGLADSPGWVPGYGHIPARLARELAAQASHWRRFLLDDDHRLIDVGRHSYRPSERLRELVTARDQTCTFPGCSRPASGADLDHRINFDGHNTIPSNLHPLCRTHHRLKTHGGWHVSNTPDGWHAWISPLGLRYTHRVIPPWLDP